MPSASVVAAAPPAAAERWTLLSPAPVEATEVAAAAFGGRIWVVGGLDASGAPLSSTHIYDPRSDQWSQGPDLPLGVHHTSLVEADGELYVIGGFTNAFGANEASQPSATVWRLTDDEASWVESDPLPEPRGAGGAAWDGRRLVYGGGVGPGGTSADVFSRGEDGWRLMGRLAEPRQHLAAASDGAGRTWFVGGRNVSLAENSGAVDVLDGDRLSPLGAPLTPRSGVGALWHAAISAVCVVGGETLEGTLGRVECVDSDGALTLLPALAAPRHGVGAAVIDRTAYVVLGGTQPGLFVSNVTEALLLGPEH